MKKKYEVVDAINDLNKIIKSITSKPMAFVEEELRNLRKKIEEEIEKSK